MKKILIVEDDSKLNSLMQDEVKDLGFEVKGALSAEQGKSIINSWYPDLVVTDLMLPGQRGDQLVTELKAMEPSPTVIVITAFGSIPSAVNCLKRGADDFLTKPLDLDHFNITLKRCLEFRDKSKEATLLRRAFGRHGFHGMIGQSSNMQNLFQDIKQVAPSQATVLICGESGTGKELVAQALHKESSRRHAPFVVINCASVPSELMESEFFGHQKGAFTGAKDHHKGHFLSAEGGTLFLDEVSEMPSELQAKLLRVLQEKKVRSVGSSNEIDVDVRVVAATNRDLEQEVKQGRFRKDLFYRLEALSLFLPPLRDRGDDVGLLIDHFLNSHLEAQGKKEPHAISQDALERLLAYDYPGNIRELSNIIERGVMLARGPILEVKDLPPRMTQLLGQSAEDAPSETPASDTDSRTAKEHQGFSINGEQIIALAELEKRYMKYALEKCGNNKRRVAALLGIGRRTLYRRLGGEESTE